MERSQIFDMMSTLKLYGMRSAYDEIMASGIKRQHEPPRIVGDLLQSEIAEKQRANEVAGCSYQAELFQSVYRTRLSPADT